ncbi:MAG: hypothetical protein IJJ23_12275 [Clostridia bacterium]|nr:hypothetical protein [Clostridia bacterium]
MESTDTLELYINAMIPEQEAFIRRRVESKMIPQMQAMSPDEAEAYLASPAFDNALYHAMRADKTLKALKQGELTLDFHRTEYERLKRFIAAEAQQGHPIDLPFLRSVEKARLPLSRAYAALKDMDKGALDRTLNQLVRKYTGILDGRVEHFLLHGGMSKLVHKGDKVTQVLSFIMNNTFDKGLTADIVDRAYKPKTVTGTLINELYNALPDLSECKRLLLPTGETMGDAVEEAVHGARARLMDQLARRFPRDRIRRLLQRNYSIVQMQRSADAVMARDQRLRAALLEAIPEHYRDLYPLAREIRRRFILHLGPTNSGKTHDGVGRLRGARAGIYLGPLRLLAAEQFDALNADGVPCSLVTGEEQIRVPFSRVQASTVEMADLHARYDVAVIDEAQMIADKDRGGAWTAAILGLCADEIHVCASPDAEALLTRIIRECGDDLSIIRHHRMTPLEVEKQGFEFPESVRKGDALIVFSKGRVHAVGAELRKAGYRVSLVYGALPPDVRRDQALRFQRGDSDVVVSTDAIAMGMNLPIQRVVFLESEKFDGDIVRPLTTAEIKQIAGRAGRYGQYDVGYVNAFGFKSTVAQALTKTLLPLEEAVIRFPESLIGIPLPLTQIINQWLSMQDKSCFSKASTERMAALAAMMETEKTDKALLYRFLCIPFDEEEQDLLQRWKGMYQVEARGEHLDVIPQLPDYFNPEDATSEMLDGLEADYRRCDLYYNYARLFIEDPDPVLDEIQRRKYLISQGIIRILSTQRLQPRTCKVCGRTLSWNWPHRLCDSCFVQRRGHRR